MKSCLLLLLCIVTLRVQAAADSLRISNLIAKPQVTKTLTGRDAAKMQRAFDGLPWDHTAGMLCHFPAFRIQRISGNSVVLDATICFTCNNVGFSKPAEKGYQGFDASADSTKEFHAILKKLFATQ